MANNVRAQCHTDRPHVARGLCRACYERDPLRTEGKAQWTEAHRARLQAQRHEWYVANRERIATRKQELRHDGSTRRADCHPNRANEARGLCGSCSTLERRNRTPANQEAHRAYVRSRRRVVAYGITSAEYERRLSLQGGVCAICREPEVRKVGTRVCVLSVDHVHGTDPPVIRGLLCSRCNRAVGFLRDRVDIAAAAAAYLAEGGVPSPIP